MMRRILIISLYSVLSFAGVLTATAKEVTDTLFSGDGDRVIVNYTLTNSGGQVTVTFGNVYKKLTEEHLRKYKVDKVSVLFFDRSGNYRDQKFEGMTPTPFMVPADITYSASNDGYFNLQDNPTLQFTAASNDAVLNVPLFLAHYEGKHKRKIFTQCGTLKLKAKAGSGSGSGGRGGSGGGGGGEEEVISSEELIEEGISPADEASIRISTVEKMLDRVKELPFSDELKDEVKALRELKMKLTDDPQTTQQINTVLDAYAAKEDELKEQAQAQADAQAQQQAHQDSIANANLLQQAQDKKEMMWLIGGIAAVVLLFSGIKQVLKMIKDHKQEKAQKAMMEKMQKLANPFGQEEEKPAEPKQHQMSAEALAAKQRLEEMRKAKQAADNPAPPPRRPSLNDQIPAKYKRWRKPGSSNSSNNATI